MVSDSFYYMVMKKFMKTHVFITILLVVVVIGALGAAAYFYKQYQMSQKLLNNPTLAAQMQTQDLIERVGKLIELPKDEQPTIATVADITKLKNQPFFGKAHNGDKVLIYTKAREAILFNPSANRIVQVAPVNIGEAQAPTTTSPTPAKKVKATPTPTKEQ